MTHSEVLADICDCIDNNITTIISRTPDTDDPFRYYDDRDFTTRCILHCHSCPRSYIFDSWCRVPNTDLPSYIVELKTIYPELFI